MTKFKMTSASGRTLPHSASQFQVEERTNTCMNDSRHKTLNLGDFNLGTVSSVLLSSAHSME